LSEADRQLGQKIAQEINTDSTLAGQISGLKISVDNGKVTLKGNVKSDEQKKTIESAVQRVTGVGSVDNQLQMGSATGTTDSNQPK
jgi:osmotically-inducible protein OsmY